MNSRKEVLSIIPARGGSKRLPKKNIHPFLGKPLIAHTICQSLSANCVSRTVVTTDDDEIANVVTDYGAEVIHRPSEISTDTATSESALLHAIDYLEKTEGYIPDIIVFMQCTSPIRTARDIESAVTVLNSERADSVVSVVPWHLLTWIMDDEGAKSYNFDYNVRKRYQETQKEYMENGSLFVFKPWILRQNGNRLGGKIALYEMHPLSCFETDTEDTFSICEMIMKQLLAGEENDTKSRL